GNPLIFGSVGATFQRFPQHQVLAKIDPSVSIPVARTSYSTYAITGVIPKVRSSGELLSPCGGASRRSCRGNPRKDRREPSSRRSPGRSGRLRRRTRALKL